MSDCACFACSVNVSISPAILSSVSFTWALASSTLTPSAIRAPIFFEALLRCANRFWLSISACLRFASSALNKATSNVNPRRARAVATASGSCLTALISSILVVSREAKSN